MRHGGSADTGDIDHFGLGVDNFRERITAQQLKGLGREGVDARSSVFIKGPNGAWAQLSAPTGDVCEVSGLTCRCSRRAAR